MWSLECAKHFLMGWIESLSPNGPPISNFEPLDLKEGAEICRYGTPKKVGIRYPLQASTPLGSSMV